MLKKLINSQRLEILEKVKGVVDRKLFLQSLELTCASMPETDDGRQSIPYSSV